MSEEQRRKVEGVLAGMTLREKIGQTVQCRLSCMDCSSSEKLEEFFQRYPVGSLFAGPDVIARFSMEENPLEILRRCDQCSRIPLAVAGDLEHGGGAVHLPSQLALAATRDTAMAYEYGKWSACGGRQAGFTWALAPESDIGFQWMNPVNNHRGLGEDPRLVAEMIPQIVRGMQDNGVSACCKHFPGDGVDFRDQHIGVSVNRLCRQRWMETYGEVYRRAFEAGLDSVMAGHISLPFMDPGDSCPPPATQSSRICRDLLRGELGFEGVLLSDALVMGGFVRMKPRSRRLVELFRCGVDVLLWPDFSYFDEMERALEDGEVLERDLDASVRRILTMKMHQGLWERGAGEADTAKAETIVLEGNAFAENLAEKGMVLARNERGILPLDAAKTRRVLLWFAANSPDTVEEDFHELIQGFRDRGAEVDVRVNGNCLELVKMEDAGIRYDAVLFFFDCSLHAVLNTCRPVGPVAECLWTINQCEVHHPIVVAMNSPYLLRDSPALETLVNTHARCSAVFRALPRLLYGEKPFVGQSPVSLDAMVGVDAAL